MEGFFFLLNLIEKRAKLLAHDWPSGCLPTACAIEELFFCSMASRFEIADEEVIEELRDKSDNENTKNSMEYWKNVFKKWVNERKFQANLRERCPRPNTVAILCIQIFIFCPLSH